MQAFFDADSLEVETPTLDARIEELAIEQGHLFVRWYDFQSECHYITRREEAERSGNDDLKALARDPKALTAIISESKGRYQIKPELLKNGLNADVIRLVNDHMASDRSDMDFPSP